ncbi:MAG: hypothetical protein V3R78_12510 [Thermodesulfobacteriota bacterium]
MTINKAKAVALEMAAIIAVVAVGFISGFAIAAATFSIVLPLIGDNFHSMTNTGIIVNTESEKKKEAAEIEAEAIAVDLIIVAALKKVEEATTVSQRAAVTLAEVSEVLAKAQFAAVQIAVNRAAAKTADARDNYDLRHIHLIEHLIEE